VSAPRQQHSEEDGSDEVDEDVGVEEELDQQRMNERRDVFEPGPDAVLEELLPRLLEIEVYQALLESAAAEHSARMLAMRNATENASSMLQELTFTFNQARQASITREISEISAGKAAIE
jgi:F-type H+-transporting ATPase subunit gamma